MELYTGPGLTFYTFNCLVIYIKLGEYAERRKIMFEILPHLR
jgi:hypothetical protein